jgi:hypothetical protein
MIGVQQIYGVVPFVGVLVIGRSAVVLNCSASFEYEDSPSSPGQIYERSDPLRWSERVQSCV